MKRMFLIPFLAPCSAAASSSPWSPRPAASAETTTTVTTVEAAAAPARRRTPRSARAGLTPHEIYERDAPGVAFVTSTVVQKTESPFNLFGGEEPSARDRPRARAS